MSLFLHFIQVGNLRDHLPDYQFSQEERETLSGKSISCLADVTLGAYFNLTCQVVSTCVVNEDIGILLRVWDGTKLNQ